MSIDVDALLQAWRSLQPRARPSEVTASGMIAT
jgi:hypothetical protein